MTSSKPILVLAFLIASTLIPNRSLLAQKVAAQSMAQETITPFITKDLPGLTGEEFQMYTVDFPPGFSSLSTATMHKCLFMCLSVLS